MPEAAATNGVHHIGLTIPDLAKTKAFFIDVLGFQQVGEKPDYPAAFVSDGSVMITLWQAKNPENAVPFDRSTVIGLHHFALKVDGPEKLDALYATLAKTKGVEIEFAPEPLGDGAVRHMMCTIPGGIRTEFIALPS